MGALRYSFGGQWEVRCAQAAGGCLHTPALLALAPSCTRPRPRPRVPQVYRRRELGGGREEYHRIGSFPGEPKPPQITDAFKAAWAAAAAAGQ